MKRFSNWLIPVTGVITLIVVVIVALNPLNVLAQDGGDSEFTYFGQTPAPEFPSGLTWLNVAEPLTMADLKGKIVLLDFWTYGCINCMHIIPDLKRLEAEFPTQLVVIGVHSAKYENEGVTENIRQILQRYDVEHPVVNDRNFIIWQTYGVQGWPTAGLIDPTGKVVGGRSGEGVYDFFEPIIKIMAQEYTDAGLIDPTPIALAPEVDKMADTPLLFPGKVLADEAGNRLFIADSGHNRIVVTSLDNYEVEDIIGSGDAALADGSYEEASFHTPQGMTLVNNTLYVADTGNHAIRAIDLTARTVTRIAGTGTMGTFQLNPGDALDIDLRSPWDLTFNDGILYIAMAGTHQLWSLDLGDMTMQPFAGNGIEELVDAPRLDAELAQPSGVATDGQYVYFADAEGSAIRRAGISQTGEVTTLIGPVNESQGRLFDFGDVDGGIDEARLQHPLGVTIADDGTLFIADTYNNKIKHIDPDGKTSITFAGKTDGGYFDGTGEEALFDEPGGLDFSEGNLYVADTNNHAIRIVDVASQSVSTILFPNVNILLSNAVTFIDKPLDAGTDSAPGGLFGGDTLVLPPQTVAPGSGVILVDAVMPFGYKLNASAPFTAEWAADDVVSVPDDRRDYQVVTPELPIEFPATFTDGDTNLSVDLTIYWCEAIKETLCFVERRTVVMPVTVSADAVSTVLSLSYELTPPDIPEDTLN